MDIIDMKFCQSCAMPLTKEETKGTRADGSKTDEYCIHCYENGAFTQECTMEEMIEQCVPFVSKGTPYGSEEEARTSMQEIFPKLARWKA